MVNAFQILLIQNLNFSYNYKLADLSVYVASIENVI